MNHLIRSLCDALYWIEFFETHLYIKVRKKLFAVRGNGVASVGPDRACSIALARFSLRSFLELELIDLPALEDAYFCFLNETLLMNRCLEKE